MLIQCKWWIMSIGEEEKLCIGEIMNWGWWIVGMVNLTLISTLNVGEALHPESIWNKEVPFKVSIFVWRLFQNRLPTLDNLSRRHILQHNTTLCGWVWFDGKPWSLILVLWLFWENMGWHFTLAWLHNGSTSACSRSFLPIWNFRWLFWKYPLCF